VEGESTILKRAGVLVPGIENIGTGPESTIEVVDKTPMNSRHVRKRPSKISDSGSIEVATFWDPNDATHAAIAASRDDSPVVEWEIEYADGTTHTFDGFVTSVKVEGLEKETDAMLTFTVEIDGDITEAVGA
jgi:hypothetical protein